MDGSEFSAVDLIAEERQRQIDFEGFDAPHDDEPADHGHEELAVAAACYAAPDHVKDGSWPWPVSHYKRIKHSRLKQLVIAGALIAAEIDRDLRRQQREFLRGYLDDAGLGPVSKRLRV